MFAIYSVYFLLPQLFCLRSYGTEELAVYIILLIVCGIFINGPYGMITTAVSSDLVSGQLTHNIMYYTYLALDKLYEPKICISFAICSHFIGEIFYP